jgi:hypothetical protein
VNAATSRASERARQSASAAWAREAVCVARSVIARWSHLAGGQPRPACERLAYESSGIERLSKGLANYVTAMR